MELQKRDLPPQVTRFLIILVMLSLLCGLTEAYCRWVLHYPWPYNWPLLTGASRFGDFKVFLSRFTYFHSPAFFSAPGPPYTYPAPVALIYRFFYWFPHSTYVFLASLIVSAFIGLFLFGRELLRKGLQLKSTIVLISLIFVCSYPFSFEFWQANVEFVIAAIVTAGIWAFLTRRNYLAATCFGVAVAAKIFPLVYLGLFLSRRRYRSAAFMILIAALVTVVSSWLLCPDLFVAFRGVSDGLKAFQLGWVQTMRPILVGCDHSLFALLKFGMILRTHLPIAVPLPAPERVAHLALVYLEISAAAGVLLYVLLIRKLPILNQVLCLSVASILLPPVSFDYTLLHLYPAWAALALFAIEKQKRVIPGLNSVFLCFAVIFAPVSEVIAFSFSLGGQVKAIALFALFLLGLHFRFESSFDFSELASRFEKASQANAS